MLVIETLKEFGRLIQVPVESRGGDGRKVPNGIDLDRFMQLNVYQWLERLPYSETIFVYNPFKKFPITTNRSIINSIDPGKKRYKPSRYRRGSHYLSRVFDDLEQNLDPLSFEGAGIVVFEADMPTGELFFQCNHPRLDRDKVGLIEITAKKFYQYYQTLGKYELFIGNLDSKERW